MELPLITWTGIMHECTCDQWADRQFVP